jgi:hypothetical protein
MLAQVVKQVKSTVQHPLRHLSRKAPWMTHLNIITRFSKHDVLLRTLGDAKVDDPTYMVSICRCRAFVTWSRTGGQQVVAVA